MKKSTRKTIKYLKRYEGHEIIRTKPVSEDWSYTENPILLVGFTADGCIRYRETGFNLRIFGNQELVLPIQYTDRNWITYRKALKAKDNKLNEWRGKKIRRIRPTPIIGDCSFIEASAPTLISASKHHMVIMYNDIGIEGDISILNRDYMNPEDWKLAE